MVSVCRTLEAVGSTKTLALCDDTCSFAGTLSCGDSYTDGSVASNGKCVTIVEAYKIFNP